MVSGDIVIGNNDKVAGYVTLDGRVKGKDGSVVGRLLSGEMAIDNNDSILGRIYKIGAAILGNDGKYIGRLTADGSVISKNGARIGYLKNNGSFVDLDKKVSGYALQEVAKNRRN